MAPTTPTMTGTGELLAPPSPINRTVVSDGGGGDEGGAGTQAQIFWPSGWLVALHRATVESVYWHSPWQLPSPQHNEDVQMYGRQVSYVLLAPTDPYELHDKPSPIATLWISAWLSIPSQKSSEHIFPTAVHVESQLEPPVARYQSGLGLACASDGDDLQTCQVGEGPATSLPAFCRIG